MKNKVAIIFLGCIFSTQAQNCYSVPSFLHIFVSMLRKCDMERAGRVVFDASLLPATMAITALTSEEIYTPPCGKTVESVYAQDFKNALFFSIVNDEKAAIDSLEETRQESMYNVFM